MATKSKKASPKANKSTSNKQIFKSVRFDAHPYEPITPSPLDQRDGSLIVVEGVDGSGKSTQLNLIARWLESNGFAVVQTEWTSSENVRPLIKQIKRKPILIDPRVFSLLYVADVAERVRNIINGALKAGMIVLCDRYVYTALSRDMARGMEEEWIKDIYDFVPRPDVAFYFQVPAEVALSRKSSMPKFYEAGMDIGLSKNPKIAFEIFQRRVIKAYDDMSKKMNFNVIDGSDRIYRTFPKVKNIVATFIKNKYGITLS